MRPLPLINFETQTCSQNEPKFNGVYSRTNLPKIKDGTYMIILDKFKLIGFHWIALYVNSNNGIGSYHEIYLDSLGAEYIHKEIAKFIGNESVITNTYRIQAHQSVKCGYFCIGFIDFWYKSQLQVLKIFQYDSFRTIHLFKVSNGNH